MRALSLQSCTSRARLLAAALLCIAIACLENTGACALALCLGAVALALSPPPDFWPRFKAVNIFILLMWLIVPWTTPGEAAWQAGFFAASRRGLELCMLASLKANAILAIFSVFLANMNMMDMGRALAGLRCPPHLAWLFLLMDRNVHMLRRQWRKLRDAARLRAFVPRTSLRAYAVIAALLGGLLLRAHERGHRLNDALLLRGFNGRIPFACPAFNRADYSLLLLACAAAAALSLIRLG